MEKIIVALFGLIWGSFLNVVIYRLPRGLSLASPPSTCPKCGRRIKPYDNIPVLSFLLLGGRCRGCGAGISFLYPAVEILTAASFVVLYGRFSLSFQFLTACIFSCCLIALCFIDLFHQILPDEITLPGLVLALVYAVFRPDMTLRQSLVGAVVGRGVPARGLRRLPAREEKGRARLGGRNDDAVWSAPTSAGGDRR